MIGRFGWKAGQPSIADQNAIALSKDIGIGNKIFTALWGDCTKAQLSCRTGTHGQSKRHYGMEVSEKVLNHLAFYIQGLAPPTQRNLEDPLIRLGEKVFSEIGCATCHKPEWITSNSHPLTALQNRNIKPYTDLLLHDMGEQLSGTIEGNARKREWRTPPLWGVGLTNAVSGNNFYLHDGRALNLLQAIVWHGGEATFARTRFFKLQKKSRDALLAFLNSL